MSSIQHTQDQVDEVVDIMKDNVNKVLERDQKLTEIEDRSDALKDGASRFQKTSGQVKSKMWWKNLKWTLLIIALIVIVIIVILLITKPWE
ncbi:hypothetical protein SARC_13059 [Sphaeroforma arctica JP610]|uniref:V-SNARE coiled-coil homology domain-containing protein n=1 Tax=Sphaeroforma arctica JP610 TaxID=667725 RepID=A0A0L0FC84_9EUKA|nr:hypothetical protein SARC_13059 [Sphaeroforma arctica JP610]KNC74392.1 hypothetical protein SARC_13059 [Sphaeroforma arctica JP610]|eukprot:XP_014148294.1 hypothetical protein SARC_13059 [Sphaeroforma arctica JP610]